MDADATQIWNRLRRNLEANRERGNARHAEIDAALANLESRLGILEHELVELEVLVDTLSKAIKIKGK